MINFASLKRGDAIKSFSQREPLVVKSVDSDGRGWWAIEFENGYYLKSVDSHSLLEDFDYLCERCNDSIVLGKNDVCQYCAGLTTPNKALVVELVMEGRDPKVFKALLERILTENGLGDAMGRMLVIENQEAQVILKEQEYDLNWNWVRINPQ